MAKSHLSVEVWVEYAKYMILGFSIRKSAKACDVSVKTSFYMRHRILDAIRNYQGIGELSGVVEMEETFLPESFKGNLRCQESLVSVEKKSKSVVSVMSKFVSQQRLTEVTISLWKW